MKRFYDICLILLTSLIMSDCVGRNANVAGSTNDSIQTVIESPFNPAMQKAIKESIEYLSQVGVDTARKNTLICIVFTKTDDGEHIINVFDQRYYDKTQIKAYSYYDGYTVAFYGDVDACEQSFVDFAKITDFSDSLPGFSDIADDDIGIHDPYGLKYRIINTDSLAIIYKGMI